MKAINFQDAREERGLKTGVQQNSLLCSLSLSFYSLPLLCVWCVCAQENALMHKGHPCEELYPEEQFADGITNGAQWYNVAGMFQSLRFWFVRTERFY